VTPDTGENGRAADVRPERDAPGVRDGDAADVVGECLHRVVRPAVPVGTG
jgi:hypothetical protein